MQNTLFHQMPLWLLLVCLLLVIHPLQADHEEEVSFEEAFELGFNDAPLEREIDHPAWFKESFLDLGEDLEEAQ